MLCKHCRVKRRNNKRKKPRSAVRAIFRKIGQYDILVQELKKGSSPSENVYCKSPTNLHENPCVKLCFQESCKASLFKPNVCMGVLQ